MVLRVNGVLRIPIQVGEMEAKRFGLMGKKYAFVHYNGASLNASAYTGVRIEDYEYCLEHGFKEKSIFNYCSMVLSEDMMLDLLGVPEEEESEWVSENGYSYETVKECVEEFCELREELKEKFPDEKWYTLVFPKDRYDRAVAFYDKSGCVLEMMSMGGIVDWKSYYGIAENSGFDFNSVVGSGDKSILEEAFEKELRLVPMDEYNAVAVGICESAEGYDGSTSCIFSVVACSILDIDKVVECLDNEAVSELGEYRNCVIL